MILEFYPIFASVVYKKNFFWGKKFPSFLQISKKSSTFAADIGLRTLQFYTTMKKILSLFTLILLVQWTFAVDPSTNLATYYANIDGKATDSNDNLRKTLCTIISNGYTTIGYSSLPNSVYAASRNPSDFYNGSGSSKTMEDIYSSYPYNSSQDGSSATTCGTGWNKEHTVPQSWFGKASPMVSDAHHVFPTDIRMNSCRSNYPYGENNASKYCSSYGYGHLGTSTFSGYTGQVFDPGSKEDCGGNCYRGDIARVYFYMATRYRTTNFTNGTGGTSFTYTNGVADLTDYMKNLMLKWHREDPVSEKELKRNNAIYAHQKNRNPFVDYPCLVEYIWGDKKGETVSLSSLISGYTGVGTDCCSSEPTLTVSSSSVTISPIATSSSTTQTFTVTGANLTGSISITKNSGSSSYITVSPTSITSGYNGTNIITITYNAPASAGTHTATLTISSTGATPVTVNITASCAASYTATWMADGSQVGTSYAASGASPDVPASNPSNCTSSRVFVGWTDNENYSGSGSGLFTDEAPTMNTDKTFYAVYADKETSGGGSPVVTTVFSTTSLGSTNTVTTGYTVSATASAKSGYYQDGSGTSGVTIYNTTTPMFTSTPSAISLTVSIGAGSGNLDFSDYVYATLVNGSGTAIGTAVQITNHVTTSTGDSYTVSIPTTGITSANGIYLYHTKESGKNIRYYSASLSITTGGSTTTYSNYSTQCTASSCTLSSITLNTSSVQKSFSVGDAFNYTGLIVTANYSDCESKTVTPTSVSSPVMSTTGNKTVTVSYTESGTTKIATYTITVEAAPEYTVTFMNMGDTHDTRTGTAGSAISAVSDPTACTGYTFEGWSTSQYAVDNTVTPSLSTPTTIPVGGATYYAVYSKTEGSGSSAATAGTTLWSEDFSGYSANNVPSGTITSSHTGTTIYGNSTITYACDNGGGTTKIYAAKLAGGTSPEILIAKSNGSFSISGIPTGSAETMTLLFNTNKSGSPSNFSITSGTSGISIGSLSSPAANQLSCSITNANGVTTFDLTITYTSSQNSREDNFLLTVATAGGGSSTTYHTTEPDCTCTATITATTDDDSMGTVSVTTP